MNTPRIAFIGAGNMARSLIGGLIQQGWPAGSIVTCDPSAAALMSAKDTFGVGIMPTNTDAVAQAEVIVLAVKPQVMAAVCAELKPALPAGALVISIAAGVSLSSLERWLGSEVAIVRCMPNTPALIQQGITGLYMNSKCSLTQKASAEKILTAVGDCVWLASEDRLNAVTAVSGSGPAYFFLLMEAMIDAGIAQGLDRETATQLTLQTALGAAKMARETGTDPARLRQQVTSPGGTTEQAIRYFEDQDFRGTVRGALQAAADRSVSLATELGEGACK